MEKEKSILALWSKQSSSGKEYLSGTINLSDLIELANGQDRVQIVVFRNDHHDNEKYPDWRGYLKRAKAEEKKEPPKEDTTLEPF